jgi:ribosomal-protein-alanine N-acetyltransferase
MIAAADHPTTTTPAIRALGPADLAAVTTLEGRCYPTPWSRSMLRGELLRRDGVQLGAFAPDGSLLGMIFAAPFAGPWHVMNVAVDPDARRAGVGNALLRCYLDATHGRDDEGHTLEVRVSNVAAIALYQRWGFAIVGTRRGYYHDTGEDAAIMWREIGSPSAQTSIDVEVGT